MNDYFDKQDVDSNRVLVIISLLFDILFFLPLVACPQSSYGRFYANQGLLLFILTAIGGVLGAVIGWIPLIGGLITGVYGLAFIVCWLIVFVGACQGKASRVPVVGFIEIIH